MTVGDLPDAFKARLEKRRQASAPRARSSSSQAQTPWQAGALLALPVTAPWAVEWLIVVRDGTQVLVVPADTNPATGSEDWAVPESESVSPLVLRLGHRMWVPQSSLAAAHRSGELSVVGVATAKGKLNEVSAGRRLSALGVEVDAEGDYREWIEDTVAPACRALAALEPPKRVQGNTEWWLWRIAAALVLGCLGLGIWVGVLWQDARRPIFSPPTTEIRLGRTDRGDPPLALAVVGGYFQLSLVLDSALEPRDGPLILRLVDAEGGLLWESDPFAASPAATHALLLPSWIFAAPGPLSLELVKAATGEVLAERRLVGSRP
jgi:hypothetical protein